MLSKYINCTRLLKIKNWLFLQIKSGRIHDILWVFLIKLGQLGDTHLIGYNFSFVLQRSLEKTQVPAAF